MKKLTTLLAALTVSLVIQSSSYGVLLTSANWTSGGIPAIGSYGGTNTLTFTTATEGNAGDLFNFTWGSMPFAAGYTTSSDSAVALGYSTGTSATTVTFSQSINNLSLWFNYIDSNTIFDFSGLNWSFVAGNNASPSGSTVVSTGGNNSDDGFLINVSGPFGPGTPLSFNIQHTGGGDTAGFTLSSAAPPLAVPEPGTYAAAALLLAGAGFMRWRKRAQAA